MDFLTNIFGEGKELNWYQMSSRGIVIFIITLLLLRISGRRSFGLRTPMDNIISITLGAVLSRAVVGVSPFIPVVATGLVIALLHRGLGWLIVRHKKIARILEGNKILLFSEGSFIHENLRRVQASEEHIMQGIRKSALTEKLEKIDKVYMERNGEISAIKKEE